MIQQQSLEMQTPLARKSDNFSIEILLYILADLLCLFWHYKILMAMHVLIEQGSLKNGQNNKLVTVKGTFQSPNTFSF